jgi:hypothetical protein
MTHYFKHKLHPIQHGLLKYKSTATNLVSYLDFIFALVSSQRHVGSIYFDLSNAFDLVRILFYFTNFVLTGFLMVTVTGFVLT